MRRVFSYCVFFVHGLLLLLLLFRSLYLLFWTWHCMRTNLFLTSLGLSRWPDPSMNASPAQDWVILSKINIISLWEWRAWQLFGYIDQVQPLGSEWVLLLGVIWGAFSDSTSTFLHILPLTLLCFLKFPCSPSPLGNPLLKWRNCLYLVHFYIMAHRQFHGTGVNKLGDSGYFKPWALKAIGNLAHLSSIHMIPSPVFHKGNHIIYCPT